MLFRSIEMVKINLEIRQDVIERLKNEISQAEVARQLQISRCGVQSILKKFRSYGSVNNLPRSGRPRKSNERSDRKLSRLSKINPKSTSHELRDDWDFPRNIFVTTAKRILRIYGLLGRIAARKPFLTKVHILRRKKVV